MFTIKHRYQEELDGGGGGGGAEWYAPLAGDNEARTEVLKGFETPDAFFAKFDEMSKAGGDGNITMERFREVATGGDEELGKALARYNDPVEVAKALVESKARIREGFKAEPYPTEGTDEEKASWRENQSMPNDAAGYLKTLEDSSIAIGEDDMPIFESLAERFLENGRDPDALREAAAWYYEWSEEQDAAQVEADAADKAAVDDALAEDFGPTEYRGLKNNAVAVMKAHMKADDYELFKNARLQDGTGVFNNPQLMKAFITMGKAIQPVSPLPNFSNDPGKSVQTRLDEIRKMSRENHDAYMKDNAIQKEELELIEIQQKLKAQE